MEETRSPRIYKIAIMILPVGVVIGTAVFMWMYYAKHKEEANEQKVIVATGIRVQDLEDMVSKLTGPIGERGIDTEQGRAGLRRASAMIEGRLGPQNLGLRVYKGPGEAVEDRLWKSLWVDVRGQQNQDEVVLAAVSYAGPGNIEDANTVSTFMMLASSLAKEKPGSTIRLVFLPIEKQPALQNEWLKKSCLKEGEQCVGIIGLHVMQTAPNAGDDDWLAIAPTQDDQAWWKFLSSGNQKPAVEGGMVPSVWLTHSVYSGGAWEGRKQGRLEATVKVAIGLRDWLLRAAN